MPEKQLETKQEDPTLVLIARSNFTNPRSARLNSFQTWIDLDRLLVEDHGFNRRNLRGQIPNRSSGNYPHLHLGALEFTGMIYYSPVIGAFHIVEELRTDEDRHAELVHAVHFYDDRTNGVRKIEDELYDVYRLQGFTPEEAK
ncbi:MAG: hypothetical protein AABY07_09520 [Nanoarchaeota archaeon]